jgi:hypothetical protein
MDNESKAILAKGLLEGYVGKSVMGSTTRSGFELKTSDYKGEEGRYHDEWDADFNGGGQELTEAANGEKATRVYAGGTLSADQLQELGLTKKDVIGQLVTSVNKLGDGTRLDKDAELVDGKWKYTYKVLRSEKRIPLDVGAEEITYDNQLVFLHVHVISPII